MELIDKQKLLGWLNRNVDANPLSIILRRLREKVESGTFDDHSTQEDIDRLEKEVTRQFQLHHQLLDESRNWREQAIQAKQERDSFEGIVKAAVIPCHVCGQNGCDCNVTYLSDFATGAMVVSLWKERNALLEGLKWYAQTPHYRRFAGPSAAEEDAGELASSIIAKIEGSPADARTDTDQ